MKRPKDLIIEIPIIWKVKSARLLKSTPFTLSLKTEPYFLALGWFLLAIKIFFIGFKAFFLGSWDQWVRPDKKIRITNFPPEAHK